MAATCAKQRHHAAPTHRIHADRGAPMRSTLVALLFSDLGVTASHSRPRVSNDNPFSEGAVPDREIPVRTFPARFERARTARVAANQPRPVCSGTNDAAPNHSGLSYLTPRPSLSTTARAATVYLAAVVTRTLFSPPMPPIPSWFVQRRHRSPPRQCPRRSGSIGRRPSPARWPGAIDHRCTPVRPTAGRTRCARLPRAS